MKTMIRQGTHDARWDTEHLAKKQKSKTLHWNRTECGEGEGEVVTAHVMKALGGEGR
jgi:hypothetical protein